MVIGRVRPKHLNDLAPDESEALQRFRDLVSRLQEIKGEATQQALTAAAIDRLVEDLQVLKHRDPTAYKTIAARLRDAL